MTRTVPFIVGAMPPHEPFADLKGAAPVDRPEAMLDGWRATREAGLVLEKKIGRVVTLSSALLHILAERRRAVARIVASGIDYRGEVGDWTGTGFLVGDNLLLTNHHVLNSVEVAAEALAEFDFEIAPEALLAGRSQIAASRKSVRLDPRRLFLTSPVDGGFDYSVVWIDRVASADFGRIPLVRSSFTVREDEQAFLIHHPDGRPKEAALDDTDVVGLDSKVLHYTSDTEPGSSGAPVLDRQGRLIALHHASREIDAVLPDGGRTRYLNEGIKIAAIALDLERRSQGQGAGASMAREVLSVIDGSDTLTGFFGALGRSSHGDTDVEKVVNTYRGDDADIDIGFWNIEHLASRYDDEDKLNGTAAVIADMKLDAWGLVEVSPEAVRRLVARVKERYGEDYGYALSEPEAGDKQSTAVIWRTATLTGKPVAWPASVAPLFRLDSRDPRAPDVEAVHGRIFDRYPGLVRLETTAAAGTRAFSVHLVPLHLKAMAEGSLRRRMASAILVRALEALRAEGIEDIIVGGDVNAPLSSGDFDRLTDAGFVALGAQDEADGAFTYLKSPKSLIDNVFLSPGFSRTFGADDFMIVAKDRVVSGFVETISDHRPIMIRLSLGTQERPEGPIPDVDAMIDAALGRPGRVPEAEPADAIPVITFAELKRRLRDPAIPDRDIRPYLVARTGDAGPFDPQVEPDPARVLMDEEARVEVESAIHWGNNLSRWRRRQAFEQRIAAGERLPVLVSEGDSWFQFPLLIDDVVDHLNRDFLILSLDAAGDTADNMILRNPEYMRALIEQKANGVSGLLLSAAGNDVIGADASGEPALKRLLKPFRPDKGAAWHVNQTELTKTLRFLEGAYRLVIATVRTDPDFATLPVLIHGYDYAIPGGFAGDPRDPSWAARDEWLGKPMTELGIVDPALQRAIVAKLIDALYAMLQTVAGDSATTHVHLVDARGAIGPVELWADEIHGTSDGFANVAARFRAKLNAVLAMA